MKQLILSMVVLSTIFTALAENVDLTDAKSWTIANVAKDCKADFTKEADGSLALKTNSNNCYLTRNINFEKGKSFRIEGKVEANCTYFIKLYFINDKDALVLAERFHIVPDTATELLVATNGKETILQVKDASKWKKGHIISVDTGASGAVGIYSTRTGKRIKDIQKKDSVWNIILDKPFGIQASQGAKIWQTVDSDGKILVNQYRLPVKTMNISYTLHPEYSVTAENGRWWPESKKVCMQVIMHGQVAEKTIRFTDFKISEINTDW